MGIGNRIKRAAERLGGKGRMGTGHTPGSTRGRTRGTYGSAGAAGTEHGGMGGKIMGALRRKH
ncbi:hypothetical protein [Crystallibacter degradans]|uniref:hypothetical protein n=1 Tax=Crystallibacter degradans TaxID=2726743 RepID=UPI0014729044|nr:hypothetical protein [Arthrobacter sp. SF27]NMR30878.1 hypothetical protein [Arthrobacter sp. SF27]